MGIGFGGLSDGTGIPACNSTCSTKTSLCTYAGNRAMDFRPGRAGLVRANVTVRVPRNCTKLVCTEDKVTGGHNLTPSGGINIVSDSCHNRVVISLRGRSSRMRRVDSFRHVTRVIVAPFLGISCGRMSSLSSARHNANNFNSANGGWVYRRGLGKVWRCYCVLFLV